MQLVFSFPNNLILKENDGGDKGKQENPNAANRQGLRGQAYLWQPGSFPFPSLNTILGSYSTFFYANLLSERPVMGVSAKTFIQTTLTQLLGGAMPQT